jgi:hypothetical protein
VADMSFAANQMLYERFAIKPNFRDKYILEFISKKCSE